MLALLNNLLGKPTLPNVLVASIWLQAAGLSAVAVIDAPYESSALEEMNPKTIQIQAQFSGVKQVESLDSTPVEIPPAESLQPDPEEPQEKLPVFEPVWADIDRREEKNNSKQLLLARANLTKQPSETDPAQRNPFADLATETKPLPPPTKISEPAPTPQPLRRKAPKNIPRQHSDAIVEFKPSVPAVSVPQSPGTDDQQPPTFSNNRPPPYPVQAYRAGIEGEVLLKLYVSRTGRVEKVEVGRSSGHRVLDEAARDAVRTWRGTPAQKNGRAVATIEHLPVRFRLRQN